MTFLWRTHWLYNNFHMVLVAFRMNVLLSWHWRGRRIRECVKCWINLPERMGVLGKLKVLIVNNRDLGEHRFGAQGCLPGGEEIPLCWYTFPEEFFQKRKIFLFSTSLTFATYLCFQRLTAKSQATIPITSCLLPSLHPEGMLLHSLKLDHSSYKKSHLHSK